MGDKLSIWREKRLGELAGVDFPVSRYVDRVTLVVYVFPPEGKEAGLFEGIKASVLHTWDLLGKLKTVIVSSHGFKEVQDFASAYGGVEVQIEPSIVPGKIKTMSMDCIKNLHKRFDTEYCLIVQDDGFPLKDNLGDFLGRCDFYGAPIISDGWKRKLAYGSGFGSFNGGFSLRSRKICEYASKKWFSFWSRIFKEDSRFLGEDFYYTTLLKLLPATWFKFKFPGEEESFSFSVDILDGLAASPEGIAPFGIHGKATAERFLDVR
jgi:hypothetical protein